MVEFITYKKEKYPVRLSYKVFKGLKADLGEVNMDRLEQLDPDVLETMLFHGLKSGHKYADKEFKFTKEDMEDILDESMFEFLELIPKFFPKAEGLGKELPNLNPPQKEEKNKEQTNITSETT